MEARQQPVAEAEAEAEVEVEVVDAVEDARCGKIYQLHYSGAFDALVRDMAERNISQSDDLQSFNGFYAPVLERCK